VIDVLFRGERGRLRELIYNDALMVHWRDPSGWCPLHWAAFIGHEDMVRTLLDAGADYRAGHGRNRTVLDVAVSWAQVKVVSELMHDDVDWNLPGLEGMTPLHWAARFGRDSLIDKLVGKGADVNRRDERGRVPLHLAAGYGHLGAAVSLIAAGAQVNAADKSGQTPLHVAAGKGQTALVECFLINGGDANLVEKEKGLNPMRLAQLLGHKDTARVLKKHTRQQAKG
ncbi:MAG: ankyrin repeat domain-containing protein, partial [Candidatus Eremiobacterota bacterium]